MICKVCELEYGDYSQNIGSCPDCLMAALVNAVPEEGDDEDSEIDDMLDAEEDEYAEPEEGDYITEDDTSCGTMTFTEYGTGKHLLTVNTDKENWAKAVKAHMDEAKFWPNVWFLSDHGNWHLLRLSDG